MTQVSESKKVHIKTYGCQMNAYDSVRMADVLTPLGYEEVAAYDDADLVILNTCHIREKAAEKVYSDLGRLRKQRDKRQAKTGKNMMIAVGGCVAQAEGAEVMNRAPYVDMVFGPQSYHRLPELITKAERKQGRVVELDFPAVEKFDSLPSKTQQGPAAFLAVQEGCDKFCTFCVVPYTRGAEFSRQQADVLTEAKQLVDGGAKEIMLLGQNVNAYHGGCSLAELIDQLAQINGLERIRYTTSHPNDMTQDLLDIHGAEAKLMPYLHLPVQSGSDAILKKMNRKHTAEFYIDIVQRLRKVRPGIAFSGDFIVGYPGETARDFSDTMQLIAEVHYSSAYSFKYSPRPGTPAALDMDQVPEDVKKERLDQLQALLAQQQESFNQSCLGQTMPVLFDRPGKREGQMIGRSPFLQSVHADDAVHLAGQIVDVTITEATQVSLGGTLASQEAAA